MFCHFHLAILLSLFITAIAFCLVFAKKTSEKNVSAKTKK